MKSFISSSIRFSVITEDSQISLITLDSSVTAQSIHASSDKMYVLIEPQHSLGELLVAERSADDLLLFMNHNEQTAPVLELQQFFRQGSVLHMLGTEGELHRVVAAHADTPQGTVPFMHEHEASLNNDPVVGQLQALVHSAAASQELTPAPLNASMEAATLNEAASAEAAGIEAPALQAAALTGEQIPQILKAVDRVGNSIGDLQSGDFTDDPQPLLVGTGTPNSYLILFDNGEAIDEIRVGADGQWSYVYEGITQGSHALAVKSSSAADAPMSEVFSLLIDSVAPARASIESINTGSATGELVVNGETTNDSKLYFSGRAEPRSLVTLVINGEEIHTGRADSTGAWSFSPRNIPLLEGENTIIVFAEDASGNIGPRSQTYTIHFDSVPPSAPTIDLVEDNVGAIQGPIGSGDSTDDTMPVVSGKAEAHALVSLYRNSVLWGTTEADANGDWSFTPSSALDKGEHVITAVASDKAGNTSQPSGKFTLVIVAPSVEPPTIESVTDSVGFVTGQIAHDGLTDDPKPSLSGTVAAGSTVKVYDGQTLLGNATVTGTTWSFTPGTALADGLHSLRVVATDAVGNTSPDATFSFTVRTSLAAPTIDSVKDDVGSVQGDISKGGITDDTTPTLSGTVTAGSTVRIYNGSTLLGSATVTGTTWTYTPSALANGAYNLRVVATDTAGNTSPDATFSLTVRTSLAAPAIDKVLDDVGSVTGNIANGGTSDDDKPTLSGTVTAGSTVKVYDGQTLLGNATVTGTTWSFTPGTALADGLHNLRVVATDVAGNTSPDATFSFTVQTSLAAPVINSVLDNVGTVTGQIPNGGITDDTTPTLSGTVTAGSTVRIYSGSTLLGSATVTGTTWTYTPSALTNGAYNLRVVATDVVGNTSPDATFSLTVRTSLSAPVINSVLDNVGTVTGQIPNGGITDDTTPTLSGTVTTGSTVRIYNGSTLLGNATVTGTTWTYTPSALANGAYNLRVVATDTAGNTSPDATFSLTVRTSLAAPIINSVLDNVGTVTGQITNGGITDDTTPTLSGTVTTGSTVRIYNGTTLLGSATVTGTTWTYTPSALANGAYNLRVVATDVAGNTSPDATFSFTVQTSLAAPVINSVLDNVGTVTGQITNGGITDDTTPTLSGTVTAGSTVRIYNGSTLLGSATVTGTTWTYTPSALANGAYNLRVVATDTAGNTSPDATFSLTVRTSLAAPKIDEVIDDVVGITGAINAGGLTNDNQPTLSGSAAAGSMVTIKEGSREIGTVIANAQGKWSFTTPVLADGEHKLSVSASDSAGNQSPSSPEFSFNVKTSTSSPSIVGSWSVDNGTWSFTGSDSFPGVLNIRGERGATVEIYEGEKLLASGTFNGASLATINITGVYPQSGAHTWRVVNTDAAGNTATAFLSFTIAAAPELHIDSVLDNVGTVTGQITNGGITDDTTPTLSGTVTAGSTVRIYNGSTLLGSATVTGTTWTYTPSALANGAYNLRVVATDTAGNTSPDATFSLTVRTSLAAPKIDEVIDDVVGITGAIKAGGLTNDNQPTLSGSAAAGSMVTIKEGSREIGTVIANAQGKWSFTTPVLADGEHKLSVSASDSAGNQSPSSPDFSFNVKTSTTSPGMVGNWSVDNGTWSFIGTDSFPGILNIRGERGATVEIYEGEKLLASGIFNGASLATINISDVYPQSGAHTWRVVNTDAAGNTATVFLSFTIAAKPNNLSELDDHLTPALLDDHAQLLASIDTNPSVMHSDDPMVINVHGASNNVIGIQDTSFIHIDGGEGMDTLLLDARNLSIDLDALVSRITGIETIDLGKTSSNSISLSAEALGGLSVENLILADGKQQFVINGDQSDSVQLKDSTANQWSDSGEVQVDGMVYQTYTSGNIELLIEQNVQVSVL